MSTTLGQVAVGGVVNYDPAMQYGIAWMEEGKKDWKYYSINDIHRLLKKHIQVYARLEQGGEDLDEDTEETEDNSDDESCKFNLVIVESNPADGTRRFIDGIYLAPEHCVSTLDKRFGKRFIHMGHIGDPRARVPKKMPW
jgi:hypothetical protein